VTTANGGCAGPTCAYNATCASCITTSGCSFCAPFFGAGTCQRTAQNCGGTATNTSAGCTANACLLAFSCGACTNASGCSWCAGAGGGGGFCQTAGSGCQAYQANTTAQCAATTCFTHGSCGTCVNSTSSCAWCSDASGTNGGGNGCQPASLACTNPAPRSLTAYSSCQAMAICHAFDGECDACAVTSGCSFCNAAAGPGLLCYAQSVMPQGNCTAVKCPSYCAKFADCTSCNNDANCAYCDTGAAQSCQPNWACANGATVTNCNGACLLAGSNCTTCAANPTTCEFCSDATANAQSCTTRGNCPGGPQFTTTRGTCAGVSSCIGIPNCTACQNSSSICSWCTSNTGGPGSCQPTAPPATCPGGQTLTTTCPPAPTGCAAYLSLSGCCGNTSCTYCQSPATGVSTCTTYNSCNPAVQTPLCLALPSPNGGVPTQAPSGPTGVGSSLRAPKWIASCLLVLLAF